MDPEPNVKSVTTAPSLKSVTYDARSDRGVYDLFLSIIDLKVLTSGSTINFNNEHLTERDNSYILSHSYYVNENELAGFEIVIPKKATKITGTMLKINADMTVSEKYTKQGQTIVIFN